MMPASVLAGLNLGAFAEDYPPEQRAELRQQTLRARGLWRRLYDEDEPGVILGDEVGKGKTYVALALAFGVLASRRKARVLVLTHSRRMAATWASRWSQELPKMVPAHWETHFRTHWQPRVRTCQKFCV